MTIEVGNCPSCKHARHLHMKEKHKTWTALERADAACTCGCGVTREEISAYLKTIPFPIPAPTGGKMRSKITLYAAVPHDADQSIILGWDEPDNDIMTSEVENLGSYWLGEYGLDNPPGKGIWVFEGEVCVEFSKGGPPQEPQDYDSHMFWEGEWRSPNDDEMGRWKGYKAKHTTHQQEK